MIYEDANLKSLYLAYIECYVLIKNSDFEELVEWMFVWWKSEWMYIQENIFLL